MLSKYKRKPLKVDAVQWDGTVETAAKICKIIPMADYYENVNQIQVGGKVVGPNDWVVVAECGTKIYSDGRFNELFEPNKDKAKKDE